MKGEEFLRVTILGQFESLETEFCKKPSWYGNGIIFSGQFRHFVSCKYMILDGLIIVLLITCLLSKSGVTWIQVACALGIS